MNAETSKVDTFPGIKNDLTNLKRKKIAQLIKFHTKQKKKKKGLKTAIGK